MLASRIHRVVVAHHRVDFRKGFDGLLGECYRLGVNPYDHIAVVFVRKDRSQIRILVGDEVGLFLLHRRFDAGVLQLPWLMGDEVFHHEISQGELSMLLEGSSFVVKKRMRVWKRKKEVESHFDSPSHSWNVITK